MTLVLTSPTFADGGHIPPEFTCDGVDKSPPLTWEGVPDNTQSLALIVDDPDMPDPAAPKMIWMHWVVYNLPASVTQLNTAVPADAKEGINDWKQFGYRGPCLPVILLNSMRLTPIFLKAKRQPRRKSKMP